MDEPVNVRDQKSFSSSTVLRQIKPGELVRGNVEHGWIALSDGGFIILESSDGCVVAKRLDERDMEKTKQFALLSQDERKFNEQQEQIETLKQQLEDFETPLNINRFGFFVAGLLTIFMPAFVFCWDSSLLIIPVTIMMFIAGFVFAHPIDKTRESAIGRFVHRVEAEATQVLPKFKWRQTWT
jgi:hypothetical protein